MLASTDPEGVRSSVRFDSGSLQEPMDSSMALAKQAATKEEAASSEQPPAEATDTCSLAEPTEATLAVKVPWKKARTVEDDVAAAAKKRKVVERLSEEQCKAMMEMPWPPPVPAAFAEDQIATKSPGLQRCLRFYKDVMMRRHAEWARIREQYATHGYAERIVEVYDYGVESVPPDDRK